MIEVVSRFKQIVIVNRLRDLKKKMVFAHWRHLVRKFKLLLYWLQRSVMDFYFGPNKY